ncbi:DUF1810 domain-containing protein [Solirhodobacter olei]|uniref:DUF1810 domain-containing protein n=1 Tax=Solirhodobacter olei TaxID=2493082 RepID=UPI000FDAF297|nr:DUF1810 domain-containing protein [Solirhodobacter olei]
MAALARFTEAQAKIYPTALAELRRGRKDSHWMWFVFPQLASLGRSATAQYYGIADLAEARAYAADPVLGPRLAECAAALLAQPETDPARILGPVDAMKLRSSATLFRAAADPPLQGLMQSILDRFYGGTPCPLTLAEIG